MSRQQWLEQCALFRPPRQVTTTTTLSIVNSDKTHEYMHAVAKRTPHKHENIIKLIKNTKKQNSAPHCCSMSVVCRLPSAAPPNIHPPRIHTKYQYCALRTCVRYYVCCLSTRQHASSRSLNGWNAFAVNGSRVRRCMRACCCLLLLPFAVCLFLSFFIFLAHSYLMVTWLSIAFALVFNFSACVVLSIFFFSPRESFVWIYDKLSGDDIYM